MSKKRQNRKKHQVQAYWQPQPSDSMGHGQVWPWLNFKGLWLEKYGFEVGDYIKIDVQPCKITITKIVQP